MLRWDGAQMPAMDTPRWTLWVLAASGWVIVVVVLLLVWWRNRR
jgi:hypothetical protein